MTDEAIEHGITVRNVKHFPAMSQETLCATGELYVDGEYTAEVSNEGHGGPWMIRTEDNEYIQALGEWVKDSLPHIVSDYDPTLTFPQSLDYIISVEAQATIQRVEYEGKLRRNIIAFDPATNRVLKFPKRRGMTKALVLQRASAQNPSYVFLDNLPQEEAIAIMVEHIN